MSLPYFPMYPSDFEAKTSHLTLAEDGAYNRLLRIMWMTSGCTIPDDDAWIMRRLRCDQATFDAVVRIVIDEYFDSDNGRLSNAKLSEIYATTNEAHQRRVAAGSKGGKAKSLKSKDTASSNTKAKPKQPEPEPEPLKRVTKVTLVASVRFEEFWNIFPHRGGAKKGKHPAKLKYDAQIKAGVSEDEIIQGAIRYASDRQVIDGYGKGPTPWLNQKGWNDDIEIGVQNNGQRTNNHPSNRASEEAERTRRIVTAAARGTSDQDWAT